MRVTGFGTFLLSEGSTLVRFRRLQGMNGRLARAGLHTHMEASQGKSLQKNSNAIMIADCLFLFPSHKVVVSEPFASRFRTCLSLPKNKEIRIQLFVDHGLRGYPKYVTFLSCFSLQRFPGAGRWLALHISTHPFDTVRRPRLHFSVCAIIWLLLLNSHTLRNFADRFES
jgi:hypothetical protein